MDAEVRHRSERLPPTRVTLGAARTREGACRGVRGAGPADTRANAHVKRTGRAVAAVLRARGSRLTPNPVGRPRTHARAAPTTRSRDLELRTGLLARVGRPHVATRRRAPDPRGVLDRARPEPGTVLEALARGAAGDVAREAGARNTLEVGTPDTAARRRHVLLVVRDAAGDALRVVRLAKPVAITPRRNEPGARAPTRSAQVVGMRRLLRARDHHRGDEERATLHPGPACSRGSVVVASTDRARPAPAVR